eukprot:6204715-Pleurochrysis_carterae.AAC.2
MERRGYSVGQIGVDEVSDVLVLLKENVVGVARDVHVQHIAYRALVLDVPPTVSCNMIYDYPYKPFKSATMISSVDSHRLNAIER